MIPIRFQALIIGMPLSLVADGLGLRLIGIFIRRPVNSQFVTIARDNLTTTSSRSLTVNGVRVRIAAVFVVEAGV